MLYSKFELQNIVELRISCFSLLVDLVVDYLVKYYNYVNFSLDLKCDNWGVFNAIT